MRDVFLGNEVLQIGEAELDFGTQVLRVRKLEIHLSAKVVHVLRQLAARPGETIARTHLIDEVWNGNHYVGQRGLTNVIWQLRRHLGGDAITTVAKAGYRLELAVSNRGAKKFSWHWYAIVAGGAFLLAAAAFMRPWPDPEIHYAESASLTYFNGVEEYPAYSRSGKRLAFSWEKPNVGARLMIRELDDSRKPLTQVSLGVADEVSPAWGPRDAELAFARITDGQCEIVVRTLATLDERVIDECAHERYHRIVEWSADGRFLFYAAYAAAGAIAILRHDLVTGETRRMTQPAAGNEDNQLAAAPGGHRLAFIRSTGSVTDIHVLEENGDVRRITSNREPVYGIAWLDSEHLVVNVLRDGEFRLWRLAVDDGDMHVLYEAETPFNIAVARDGSRRIAFSLHRGTEYLEFRDHQKDVFNVTLASTGRDLYGDYSAVRDELVFLSTRSGEIRPWISRPDGSNPRMLMAVDGLPGVPRWSPDSTRIAMPFMDSNGSGGITLLNPETGAKRRITDDAVACRNISWIDRDSLLVSSDRDGRWNLWRFDLGNGEWTQMTASGGRFGQVHEGMLYFTRPGVDGLWRRAVDGGAAEKIVENLSQDDWGSWGIGGDALYYVVRQPDADEIWRLPLIKEVPSRVGHFPRNSIRIYRGLAVAADGSLVVTRLGNREADIIELSPVD